MRIAYVVMQWPIASQIFAARDIRALRQAGHDVIVYALRRPIKKAGALKQTMGIADIPEQHPNTAKLLQGLLLMIRQPCQSAYLLKTIFKHEKRLMYRLKSLVLLPAVFWCGNRLLKDKPDIVHLFWGHYPSLLGILLKRLQPSIKVSMFLGATDMMCAYGLSRLAAADADLLITHAHANKPMLAALGFEAERFHVIHRGLETQKMQVQNLQRRPKQLILLSRLIKDKGADAVLDVMAELTALDPEINLIIVGDGPEKTALQQQAERLGITKYIAFLGMTAPEKVIDYLAQSRLSILLSNCPGECLPNAVKEAMLLGAVPIVSKTRGIDELIDGTNGIVLDDTNPKKIAQRIHNLLQNPAQLEEMALAAKAKIVQDFDVTNSMQRSISLWEKI